MRLAPTLLVLTLAASTASVAAPVVELPGRVSAHVVEPRISEVPLVLPAGLSAGATTLAPIPAPAFALLGLTWDRPVPGASVAGAPDGHDSDVGPQLSVRTRADGTWSDWTALEADGDGPDGDVDAAAADASADPAGRTDRAARRLGTAPLWVGNADAFQVRLDHVDQAALTGLRAVLVDPGRSAADADVGSVPRVASQAHATIAWPTVYRRKDWGADEKLRKGKPRYTGRIQAAFVHHTAGTNDYTPAEVPKILRGIFAYHVKGRGWSDVGYNFLVDKFGRIWEGRAGGIDRAVLGAHTGGFNKNSFGVSVLGDYTRTAPTPETLAAVARIIAWKFGLTGDGTVLDPLATVELISEGGGTSRYKSGTHVDFVRVSAHRDAGRTECPGALLYAQLPTIRSQVRDILVEESPFGPSLPEPSPGATPVPPADGANPAGGHEPDEAGDSEPTDEGVSPAATSG
ncbi:N-acetylmuramoyl-L-alanine amidase [Sporichthya brevicatena]|uniref:N-acetylmuramoyl-L-alanine amidase n=1 Tax=Sporichthya brevicatena TaxID=171442 RepID=A0ABP3RCK3_9ACTN